MDFAAHTRALLTTLKHYMTVDPVPDWDFFAKRQDAAEVAAATPDGTAKFSRILGVCEFLLEEHILPYTDRGPIAFNQNLMADSSLAFLQNARPSRGEQFLTNDEKVTACGSEPYHLSG